jgi:hypothetical protein
VKGGFGSDTLSTALLRHWSTGMDDRDKITWKQQLPARCLPVPGHLTVYSIPKYYFLAETLIVQLHCACMHAICGCAVYPTRDNSCCNRSTVLFPVERPKVLEKSWRHSLAPPGTLLQKILKPWAWKWRLKMHIYSWNLVKKPSKHYQMVFSFRFWRQ